MKRLLTTVSAALLLLAPMAHAQDFDTRATAAWVYDQTTDTVLLAHNADVPLPPASMSKLMTVYMAFEAIADGRLREDEELTVSEHAASYGGSSMFLRSGERVNVTDLLRGIIVLSGNDASAVIAEALSPDGTEAGFARMMTDRAQRLGMTQSNFANSNGWPAEGQRMSMHDLGILADHLIEDYPTYYTIFSEETFPFDGRVPANSNNRNPILGMGLGADGLKTGHTQEAGYGLVGSAVQDDRRVIFVITGLDSEAARREESGRILNWAFRQFAMRDVGRAGTHLAEADVWMGAQPSVGLVLGEDLNLLVPSVSSADVSARVVYNGPLAAPIAEGQEVAQLVITREGLPEVTVPLLAEQAVSQGGFTVKLSAALSVLMGKMGIGQIDTAPAETDAEADAA